MLKIIVCLIGVVLCTKELKDRTDLQKVYDEKIPNTEYAMYTNQTLSLTYHEYPGVFTMDLKKRALNGTQYVYQNEDYESYQEDAGANLAASGCMAFQREISTSDSLAFGLPSTTEQYFTDIAVVPLFNKAFAVRSDFQLYEVNMEVDQRSDLVSSIAYPGNHTSFINKLGAEAQDSDPAFNNPYLVKDPVSQRIFILTNFGGVSFDPQDPLTNKMVFTKEPFKKRLTVYDVFYCARHKAFFVAAGMDGIDAYQIDQGRVTFIKTFDALALGEKNINIVDIDASADGTKLYVLDSTKGFTYVDITDLLNHKLSTFVIPIAKATAFDHFQNTFMFIATSIYNQDYAVEVFVDFTADTFYYNRFYEDEMQLFDIVMFDFYAVLVGYDAHKLIFHSLYHGFINDKLEHHTIFTEPELVKVMEYEWNTAKSHHQLVGLGRYEFKTFHVEYVHPTVKCHSNEPYKQEFLLQMNSTDCKTKQVYGDNSQFSSCNINHAFTLDVQDVFISTTSKIWVIIASIFAFVLIFSLVWALYLCWSKWGRNISLLDNQILDLKKQEKYGNLQEAEQHNIKQDV